MDQRSQHRLILATESPYKIELLQRLDLRFEALAAHIDEARRPGESPRAMASRLAIEKARHIAAKHPDAYVLGADQVIALDDHIFQKPGTVDRAVAQIMQLQGKTHQLITAIALCSPSGQELASGCAFEMVMRPLTEAQARAYVEADQLLGCAGSYRIEARG